MKDRRYAWAVVLACAIGTWGCSDDGTTAVSGTGPGCTGDACGVVTPENLCGNGGIDTGEACDDKNQNGGDGCSADCLHVEADYECTVPGQPCTYTGSHPEVRRVCGDGIIQPGEACDDHNQISRDGCSADCETVESGFVCLKAGEPCTPTGAICGNQVIETGEACDNGDTNDGDGCSASCQIEEGWNCDDGFCWRSRCGNGTVENGEQCDPGSASAGGYGEYGLDLNQNRLCIADTCQFAPYCGDGTKDEDFGEECDLGKDQNTAGYSDVTGCTAECKKPDYCGDGKFSYNGGLEKCDPSVPGGNPGCNDDCTEKDGFSCSAVDGTCREIDSIKCDTLSLDAGEDCDQSGNGCANCRVQSGYKCIGSVASPCSQCTGDHTYDNYPCCTQNSGQQCKEIAAGYGDGILDPDGYEECDDGNKNPGDGCSATGTIEPGFICRFVGQLCTPICGDGKVVNGEKCDDGNRNGGDGCSAVCEVEPGYYCKTPGIPCELDTCGNGYTGTNEVCDGVEGCCNKGDNTPWHCDECHSVKAGWCYSVSEGLTHCMSGATHGDYILQGGEECDDGNKLGGDGCSPDGKIEYGFECPTGVACRPICGDGKVMWQIGEECDLGPDNGMGKGCSITCEIEEGFECTDPENDFPEQVDLDVTYRDFRGWDMDINEDGAVTGLVTDEVYNILAADSDCTRTVLSSDENETPKYLTGIQYWLSPGDSILRVGRGFPDFQSHYGLLCLGIAGDNLDADGKPVFSGDINATCCGHLRGTDLMPNAECKKFKKGETPTYTNGAKYNYPYNSSGNDERRPANTWMRHHLLCGASFNKWFRSDSRINNEIKSSLPLYHTGGSRYVFDAAQDQYNNGNYSTKGKDTDGNIIPYFCPIDGKGFNDDSAYRWLLPKTGPIWKHSGHNGGFTTEIETYFIYKGGETLNFNGDDDLWVYINGKLFLDIGGLHGPVEGWNTLENSKECESIDAKNGGTIKRKCDERFGIYENGIYQLKVFHAEREASGSNFKLTLDGFINPSSVTCDSKCGDGILASNEECDIGGNHTNDDVAQKLGCINCKWQTSKTCGNGRIEEDEACDTGYLCENSTYKAACDALGLESVPDNRCNKTECRYYDSKCGNDHVDDGEECDSDDPLCNRKTCKWYCGDGIVNADKGEECDRGSKNNNDGNSGCMNNCKRPFCGDGIVSSYAGEICDDGQNDSDYGKDKCMAGCVRLAPYCGDGKLQSDREDCDLGEAKNNGLYGGCKSDCTFAPRCGDGNIDAEYGETCDDNTPACVNCRKHTN